MKIYRMKPYTGNEFTYIVETGFDKSLVFDLIDGIKIEKPEGKIVLSNQTKKKPDLMGTGSSEFFVSDELKLFFENNIENRELNFIPFSIAGKTFWLLNIVGLRDCMDYEKSEYTTFKSNNLPDEITRLAVIKEKIDLFDIFRLQENPIPVFVTESIKLKMEELNFKGIKFLDNNDLTFG